MPHIFISYAKKDTRDLAIRIEEAFNAIDGVTAWVDRSMRAGKAWEIQIQREILRCDFMVVLYSPDINRHLIDENTPESYVLTEISYAKYTAKKPIIPVMAQRTDPPISLTMEHYIDFIGMGLTLDDLIDALCFEMGIAKSEAKSNILIPKPPVIEIPPKIITPTRKSSLDLLPKPFAWIPIPEGKVTLITEKGWAKIYIPEGQSQTFTAPAFEMAKYPCTNAQFKLFMDAGGYTEKRWWTEDGWQAKLDGWDYQGGWKKTGKAWIQPRFWGDDRFKGDDKPIIGVSWYEAVAFCTWLSEITREKIMLPTEQQWQRAAQGDKGLMYPWGNEWDGSRCNNNSQQTTPVRHYEGKGDSPFGVTDMSGNVWEWCLTAYETGQTDLKGTDVRVLRGGSWYPDNVVKLSSNLDC